MKYLKERIKIKSPERVTHSYLVEKGLSQGCVLDSENSHYLTALICSKHCHPYNTMIEELAIDMEFAIRCPISWVN